MTALSREWSRRVLAQAQSQTKIPAQVTERTTRGRKSRYIFAFYLAFRILTTIIVEWLVPLLPRVILLGI